MITRKKTGPRSAGRERAAHRVHLSIRDVAAVSTLEREQMFRLLDRCFLQATQAQFETDLDEKEWVLLGTEAETGSVCGFTTLMRLRTSVDGERVAAFYSGDTVVEPRYWGQLETSRAIARLVCHMFESASAEPYARWYWFLISSTYRSYRLLPMIFRCFHPSPNGPMPTAEDRALAALVREKTGFVYDPRSHIIRLPNPTVFPSQAHGTQDRGEDPWERFFLERNPGHACGDRLASLTPLTAENLTPLGLRLLRRAAAENRKISHASAGQ